MAISVVMPALELAQDTGQLLAWRKKEGDRVTKGEPLAEIETDKAVVEIESPGDGILAAISAREGDVVPVGRTIAWLVSPGESPPENAVPAPPARTHASMTAISNTGTPDARQPAGHHVVVAAVAHQERAKRDGARRQLTAIQNRQPR